MLNTDTALELARRLTVVAEFPKHAEAIEAIAEDLVMLTEDVLDPDVSEARARWLVKEVRQTWTAWSGTSDMIALYRKRFENKIQPTNAAREFGEKPKTECRICNDTGAFKPGGRESSDRYVWCECQAGITLHFDLPDWLSILNGEPVGGPIFAPDPVQEIAKNPIHSATERELQSVEECPACLEKRRHTHAEYSKHHVKQESPQ